MLAWSIALAILLGLALLLLGWRGSLRNRHPHCRACRFDLEGLWPSVARCPECGAALAEPRAIRVGRRRPRLALLGAGLLLTLAGAGVGGAIIWGRSTNYNWSRHKPDSWLIADLRSGTQTKTNIAIRELERRAVVNQLTSARAHEIADVVIGSVGTDVGGIHTPWEDLFTAMLGAKLLDASHFERFIAATFRLNVHVPARARRGQRAPILVAYEYGPFGQRYQPFSDLRATWELSAFVDGMPLEVTRPEFVFQREVQFEGSGGEGGNYPHWITVPEEAVGSRTLRLMCQITIAPSSGVDPVTIRQRLDRPLEIVEQGESVVELVQDAQAIAVTRAWASASARVRLPVHRGYPALVVHIDLPSDQTVAVVGDVFARWDDQEVLCGTIEWYGLAGLFNRGSTTNPPPIENMPDVVDVIFRPNRQAAEDRGIDRILGVELVFENVPVEGP